MRIAPACDEMPMKRVEDLLREHSRRTGAQLVPGFEADGVSYADLDGMSERLAGALISQGVVAGERIAALMDNSSAALACAFAALKAGAVFCPVGPDASADELAFVLNDCPAACLFVDARFAPVAAAAMAEAPLLRLVVVAGASGAPAIDGLLRFEDAVAAPHGAAAPCGPLPEVAVQLYVRRADGIAPGQTYSHGELLAAARGGLGREAGELAGVLSAVAGLQADVAGVAA
jgi:acyl-CoA synthetase (AMP-forming)/AMP-acid ligase II